MGLTLTCARSPEASHGPRASHHKPAGQTGATASSPSPPGALGSGSCIDCLGWAHQAVLLNVRTRPRSDLPSALLFFPCPAGLACYQHRPHSCLYLLRMYLRHRSSACHPTLLLCECLIAVQHHSPFPALHHVPLSPAAPPSSLVQTVAAAPPSSVGPVAVLAPAPPAGHGPVAHVVAAHHKQDGHVSSRPTPAASSPSCSCV